MQDGRMASLAWVQLFGPDGTLKTNRCDNTCVNCPEKTCDNCPEKICGDVPEEEESDG